MTDPLFPAFQPASDRHPNEYVIKGASLFFFIRNYLAGGDDFHHHHVEPASLLKSGMLMKRAAGVMPGDTVRFAINDQTKITGKEFEIGLTFQVEEYDSMHFKLTEAL